MKFFSKIIICFLFLTSCNDKEDLTQNPDLSQKNKVEMRLYQSGDEKTKDLKGIYNLDSNKGLSIVWQGIEDRNLFCNIGLISVRNWEFELPTSLSFDLIDTNVTNEYKNEVKLDEKYLVKGKNYSVNLFCIKSDSETDFKPLKIDGSVDENFQFKTLNMRSLRENYLVTTKKWIKVTIF